MHPDWPDYLTAVGQEFSQAIDPDGTHDLVPQDACDAVLTALTPAAILPSALAWRTEADHAALAASLADATGCPVDGATVAQAVARLLRRWPPGTDPR